MQLPGRRRYFSIAGVLVLTLMAVSAPERAQAQKTGDLVRRLIHEFVGVGGYWFTDSSARDALGSPKFTGDSSFYVKPAHRRNLLLTGGIEIVGASDHWFVGGGNSFDLYGGSFRVSGEKKSELFHPVPFLTGGAFLGHIHSEKMNFKETTFVPSMAVGAETKIHRYFTLKTQYRISGHMHGVSTDGFSVSLKLF